MPAVFKHPFRFQASSVLAAITLWAVVLFLSCIPSDSSSAEPLAVLVIDGQNNHKWQETTPRIVQLLRGTGRFVVDVATTPQQGQDIGTFQPDFGKYAAIVSNYNGEPWGEQCQKAFVAYVAGGGGFVSVHAADNAFPKWDAYNRMIGLGGWGGRNEASGPYVRWRDGRIVREGSPGRGGSHGRRHPFEVVVRDASHPITSGLPRSFLQAEDELYAELRGPAENMHVLATAFSSPESGGTGQHEPILMTVHFGEGRVFHTTLGHDVTAMNGLAFQVTLQRGTEWAATGEVTMLPTTVDQLSNVAVATRDALGYGAGAIQVSEKEIPNPASDGWIPLLNGKDLSGWSQKNGTASFSFEDGAVVGRTAVGSPNSFLCTTENYKNFELAFEVKVDVGLNSGVQIRSLSLPEFNAGRVHGPQVEIESLDENGASDSGYIYSEGTGRQWLSTERTVLDTFKNNEWNRYLIRAVGNRMQTWVNGVKVADLTDAESPTTGFIGLQVHGIAANEGPFEVRWRDISLRQLDDNARFAE